MHVVSKKSVKNIFRDKDNVWNYVHEEIHCYTAWTGKTYEQFKFPCVKYIK